MESPPWPDAVYVGSKPFLRALAVADGIYILDTISMYGNMVVDFHTGGVYYPNIQDCPQYNHYICRYYYGCGQSLARGVTYTHKAQLDGIKIAGFVFADRRMTLILSADGRWIVMRQRTFCSV